MFDKAVFIKGKHATYMKQLAAKFDTEMKQGIFNRNIDVYMIAPIIGKLYNRSAKPDSAVEDDTRIHFEQINEERKQLETVYRTLMMLEEKDSLDVEERSNRAFKYDDNEEKRKLGDMIFDGYLRGGIEVLYEKILENAKNEDDYVKNLYDFVVDVTVRYEEKLKLDEIRELCKLEK